MSASLNNFGTATSCGNLFLSRFAELVGFDGQFLGDFTATEDLDSSAERLDEMFFGERFGRNFGSVVEIVIQQVGAIGTGLIIPPSTNSLS